MTSRKRRLQLRKKRHAAKRRRWVKKIAFTIDYGVLDAYGAPIRQQIHIRHLS